MTISIILWGVAAIFGLWQVAAIALVIAVAVSGKARRVNVTLIPGIIAIVLIVIGLLVM